MGSLYKVVGQCRRHNGPVESLQVCVDVVRGQLVLWTVLRQTLMSTAILWSTAYSVHITSKSSSVLNMATLVLTS